MDVTQISPDWQTLQGTTLEGGYELKEIIEAAEKRAVLRVRVLGDYTLKANAIFYDLASAAAEEQAAIWQSIRYFQSKTAISVPLGAGKLKVNGVSVAYVVYQVADETLAIALEAQALTPEQAMDATRSLARGLSELHGNGYVHGDVAPGEIRAVGDRVEVSTEAVRRVHSEPIVDFKGPAYRAPESGERNLTIASDIWCLGATVFESLTRKHYEAAMLEQASEMPHPFGTLLAGCLDPDPDKRVGLDDFERILRSKAPPPKPKPIVEPVAAAIPKPEVTVNNNVPPAVAVDPQPKAEPIAAKLEPPPISNAALGFGPAKEPLPKAVPPPTRDVPIAPSTSTPTFGASVRRQATSEDAAHENEGGFSARRGWIYAAAAFAVICAILWFLHGRGQDAAATKATPPLTDTAATKQPAAAWPTKTLTPDAKNTASDTAAPSSKAPPSTASAKSSAASPTGARTIWHVVLYTYRREPDAQKRVEQIASKRPDLHPQVFAVETGGPYLVVAGEGTTRDEAARTRQRAVREGMPHDSYIQNYNH